MGPTSAPKAAEPLLATTATRLAPRPASHQPPWMIRP